MASTWSALKIELLETGQNSGTWGTLTNVNLGDAVLGEAITGSATVDFPTDADVTVTLTDSATSQSARNLRLNITESSTGVGSVRSLILGSGCQIEKFYLINNTGTGAKTVKNTTGTGISVPAGKATLVYNNGTNVVDAATYFTSLTLGTALPVASGGTGLSSGTSGGVLAYTATGTLASSAALTQYGVVYGGGAGAVPVATAAGTTGQVLTATTSGAPSWAAPATSGTVTSVAMTVPSVLSISGSPITSSGTLALTYSGTALPVLNGGTGVTTSTGTTNVVLSNSPTLVTPNLGSPSSVGTMPAFTLGGTVSGGGNQINNVVIGTTTPLAGAFTTLSSTTGSNFATSSGSVGVGTSSPATYGGFSVRRAVTTVDTTNCSASFSDAANSTLDIGHTSGLVTINAQGGSLAFNAASSERGRFSSTGLAVTGALSASGKAALAGAATSGYNTAADDLVIGTHVGSHGLTIASQNNASSYIMFADGTTGAQQYAGQLTYDHTTNEFRIGTIDGTTRGVFSSTGLAVTGTLSATGTLSGGTSGTAYSFSGSAPATSLTLDSSGNLGVGTSSPSSYGVRLVARGVASVYGDERKVLSVVDTTALAAGVGGGISFYGVSESSGAETQFGSIKGIKENATSANYAGALAFVTSSSANVQTERMRLDSSGNLGIGTSSPAKKLDVVGTLGVSDVLSTRGLSGASDGLKASQAIMLFDISAANWAGIQASNSGNVSISAGDTTINTWVFNYSNGALQLPKLLDISAASAGQIQFPATQNASADANTLDDYEEGTFTATLTPLTSGTITLSAATCTYTKIGRSVTVNGQLDTSAISSPVGRLRIGGLPFTLASGTQFESRAVVTVNGAVAIIAIDSWLASGGNFIDIYPAGTTTDTYASNIDGSTSVNFSGTYFV